jgi:squalene-hopene/tetraprenyl-beta-curcumene cyclase
VTDRAARLSEAITLGRRGLVDRQQPDGHWVGELEGDSILESEYVLLMAFLGRERGETVRMVAEYLRRQQTPEGGWSIYPGGPAEVSASVKAYLALKIMGHSPDEPQMRRAAAVIRGLGGTARCNSFTKFYLALLGQIPYDRCPAVPPELILLPLWCYVNIYAMSAWSRTILVPLSIASAYKPVRKLPEGLGIRELEPEPPPALPVVKRLSWANFFLKVDALLKFGERWGLTPFRRLALRRAVAWLRDHYAESDGVGAIFPPMVYNVIALRCLDVPDDAPEMRWAMKQLDELMIEEGGAVRLQPCKSPVWDTALTLIALADAGVTGRAPETRRAVTWLLRREIRRPGDWSLMNPNLEPGGWVFEYHNAFYPDTDDTAMALIALARYGRGDEPAARRGVNWLLGMQNKDGGWAAFDRDIDREILTKVPFADHNAMLDPSCPDITARVLEALGHYGHRPDHPQVQRALRFLARTQEPHGGWPGRWGVNYVYGTWQVLVGLRGIGLDMGEPMVRKAADWLKRVQQPRGGWGESCASYDDPSLAGVGTPTASQTAWALLGLIAAGEADSPAVRAGVDYLTETQGPDGGWAEETFTGTGFPRVFYLKYHLYPVYFPLMALGRYQAAAALGPAGTLRSVG